MTATKQTLAQKVLAVSQAIGHVEKNGLNSHFKFRYQAWDDVLPAVRNACVEVGVHIKPTVISMTNDSGHVVVQMEFTVADASTGESESFTWFGEAKGNDDKGVQKAITSCMKYALLKYFLIPIVDDTDADADAGTTVSVAKPKATKKQTEVESITILNADNTRAYFAKTVYANFEGIGGTMDQFQELKTNLAAINYPLKATDILHEALQSECKSPAEIYRWIATKHQELPRPFTLLIV
jgi:hypothetical protein